MTRPCFTDWTAVIALKLMRPLALAGASGGLVSALFHLAQEVLRSDFTQPEPVFCPTEYQQFDWEPIRGFGVDLKSLCLGIFLGVLLGPVLETLGLLRQLWALQLRAYFGGQGVANRPAFRVLA